MLKYEGASGHRKYNILNLWLDIFLGGVGVIEILIYFDVGERGVKKLEKMTMSFKESHRNFFNPLCMNRICIAETWFQRGLI